MKRYLRAAFKGVLKLYFSGIEEVGERPAPTTGGRVFVSNHKNALIDPILVLTHAPCDISPLGKSTLWQMPGLKWLLDLADAVPVQRRSDDPNKAASANDEMFDKIAQHLARGGNVLVFPEGTSHNEPHMIRLKTGAARMLDRARKLGARDLSFQAVGLEFDSRHKFRSKAVVAYGPARALDDLYTDAAEGEHVEHVTQRMHDDLADMVIEGATWEERRLVLRVAELIRNESASAASDPAASLSFAEAVRVAQGVERARDALEKNAAGHIEEVSRSVDRYFTSLERLGLGDEQVKGNAPPHAKEASVVGWLALPLFPVGVALYFLPYQLPRIVAARTDEVDQHSTLKLGTGLVAYPVWAGLLIGGAWALARTRAQGLLATAVILASPFAALHWLERTEKLRRAVRRSHLDADLEQLVAERREALAAIASAQRAAGT
ncbi:MAG: 1-acyl-sn-glycerol-3-phosphate acyltransferase [Myxococcales bacterium]|nr:1-acyl-sn-glycerol-3-phosphate acyltransferase [Myxococcales bacterium]